MNSVVIKVCVSCIVTILLTSVAFIIICYTGEASWWGSDKSSILGKTRTEGDYCETFNSHLFLHERMNSISNLAFIIFGEMIIFCVYFDSKNLTQQQQQIHSNFQAARDVHVTSNINSNIKNDNTTNNGKLSGNMNINYNDGNGGHGVHIESIWLYLYGIFVIWIGITSFMFHASYKKFSQHLDVTAIYFLEFTFLFLVINIFIQSIFIQTIGINNTRSRLKFKFTFILITIDAILCVLTIIFRLPEIVIIVIVIGSLFLCSILLFLWIIIFIKSTKLIDDKKFLKKLFIYSLISFVLLVGGFCIRQLDLIICYPNSIFQIHALFHVIIASGVAFGFLIFRTIRQYENKNSNNCNREDSINQLELEMVNTTD